ncbi:YciI family protein [Sinimarinibacterium sp. CAU 1509]|uniref:YciI family protein n=1 Tax=Sinimarinibacterium sp. CAU 1509 TaxID=2562283 RepID=UPI0010AC9DD1|nr:YciI family protein [Sinimarinibacterium sp. CAU 1509]
MLYMILGHDRSDSLALRRATRPEHVAYLQQLIDQGRLVMAGPRPRIDASDPGDAGFAGSLIVAEFDDLASAKAWAAADPYQRAGVFDSVVVEPFIKALP